MPLIEVGFGLVQESSAADKFTCVAREPHTDNVIIQLPEILVAGDEDWINPDSSMDPGPIPPILRSISSPEAITLPKTKLYHNANLNDIKERGNVLIKVQEYVMQSVPLLRIKYNI